MNTEELAAARGNVKKFEPSHGWDNDTRPIEWLTTGELLSLCAHLKAKVEELSVHIPQSNWSI